MMVRLARSYSKEAAKIARLLLPGRELLRGEAEKFVCRPLVAEHGQPTVRTRLCFPLP